MLKVLAGAWRTAAAAPLEISAAELETAAPLLLESGVAALCWRRLRDSPAQAASTAGAVALQLEQAYRLHTLRAAIHERDIQRVLKILRAAGIEPILVKGWAISRLYPEQGLRPYGDIDLCVDPAEYAAAHSALARAELKDCEVDLHKGFNRLDERTCHELYSRSQLVKLDRLEVRVPSAEDHLRILCFHFLREGAWRPLWLCDIAVALEQRPADFDWELFLGESQRRRDWYASAIVLAHQLLGANTDGVPAAVLKKRLPGWFVPTVLVEWERRTMRSRYRSPMSMAGHAPLVALKNLRYHWPNAIEGTIGLKGPFNELPRLPFQAGNCILRAAHFLSHLRQTRRRRS
jgi:hypothetical protein